MPDRSDFFDETRILVRAGDGGHGSTSFRREKFVPFGGPDGGHGGKGGDVYLVASPHLNTLLTFRSQRRFRAHNGSPGRKRNQTGRSARDLEIEVPVGTIVKDANAGEMLADLVEVGQRALVARGGRGGRGNASFATPTNQSPRVSENGEPGEERSLGLELRLIADVGIVGKPNAGKSTLLAAVSAARPKIADYPFTTLIPNLGVVEVGLTTFVMADIPGLIEGAHAGAGLGDRFLKHIQRTRLLVHLLDGASRDPLADLESVNAELALFDPALARRPQIIVLNKLDLPEARERWPELSQALARRGWQAMAISAATREDVDALVRRTAQLLAELPRDAAPQPETKVFRPPVDEEAFEVKRDGAGWKVRGIRIERAAAMTNWSEPEAIARFQRLLDAMGITEALRQAGVHQGDSVGIGPAELEWHD